jgi:5-methylcytosine-specific restriction endonuclease McrA
VKTCSKCKEAKSFEMFSKQSAAKDGLKSWCRRCSKEYMSVYGPSHSIQHGVSQRKYDAAHKENKASRMAVYYKINVEEYTLRSKRWRADNPEKSRAKTARYRARKLHATIGFMPEEPLQELIKIYGPLCIVPGCARLATTADHVIPLTKDGPHSFDNLQPMCGPHNSSKGNRNSTDYR